MQPSPARPAARWQALWRDAVRETFPETAIAVAAKALGLDVARAFEERGFRGHTLHVRRTTSTWTPSFETGPARLTLYGHPPDALFVDRPFRLEATPSDSDGVLSLWARGPDGELAMRAEARFDD